MFTYIQLYILRVKYGFDVYITENVLNHLRMLFDNVSGKLKKNICTQTHKNITFIDLNAKSLVLTIKIAFPIAERSLCGFKRFFREFR